MPRDWDFVGFREGTWHFFPELDSRLPVILQQLAERVNSPKCACQATIVMVAAGTIINGQVT
jgi:hypothetical protein